mmetsp:Transcript_20632/g.45833  ORF Transcript_20632/g.45833 Transcript_20632/m.45833 type:complete len:303 (-) Transcript_20632:9-917(-)
MVAIVCQHIVRIAGVLSGQLLLQLGQQLQPRAHGGPHAGNLLGLAEGGGTGVAFKDRPSEPILLAVDHDTGVPDALHGHAQEQGGEHGGDPLADIVLVDRHLVLGSADELGNKVEVIEGIIIRKPTGRPINPLLCVSHHIHVPALILEPPAGLSHLPQGDIPGCCAIHCFEGVQEHADDGPTGACAEALLDHLQTMHARCGGSQRPVVHPLILGHWPGNKGDPLKEQLRPLLHQGVPPTLLWLLHVLFLPGLRGHRRRQPLALPAAQLPVLVTVGLGHPHDIMLGGGGVDRRGVELAEGARG